MDDLDDAVDAVDAHEWTPWTQRGARLRITQTSCCGEYELACEGGQYLVLRWRAGRYEETAHAVFAEAHGVFTELAIAHRCDEFRVTWAGGTRRPRRR